MAISEPLNFCQIDENYLQKKMIIINQKCLSNANWLAKISISLRKFRKNAENIQRKSDQNCQNAHEFTTLKNGMACRRNEICAR